MLLQVTNLVKASLTCGQQLHEAVFEQSENVLDGCDALLLELRSLSDAREAARAEVRKERKKQNASANCPCATASSMFPTTDNRGRTGQVQSTKQTKGSEYDDITEDFTDKALLKIEACK